MHFSEADTRHKFIDSQLERDWWQKNQIICEFDFTDGRKLPGNKRWERKKADYILSYKWVKLAIIEAKKYSKEPTEWLEQAKQYAKILNIRFVFSTNWQKIYQFDMQTGFWGFVENYPEPEKLYEMVFWTENITKNILLQQNYLVSDKKPRYYQEIAIQKTMEAIAEWKNRILLNLATGTGKTVIAFQICYKLFEAKWSLDGIGKRRPKILFLADRNVLVDQAMNTFNYFEKDYKNIQNGIYEINYKDKQYLLEVENVKIKCFDTNIGILSFILNNKSYEELEDILSINNFGRKLYRAYETEECPTINLYNSDKELEITQNISEANIIEITKERNIEKLENKIISYFLKTENIEIIQDDRMFVISHYLSQNWENINPIVSLKNDIEIKDYKKSEDWYKYIFIDTGSPMCQDEEMMEKLLKKATYSRWKNAKTMFGICRYSFVVSSNNEDFANSILNNHVKNQYFQLVSLLIAQRATIISLNEGMNALINRILNSEEIGKESIEYDESDEFKEYLIYLSKMNFQEISQQEQGIELYDLFREQLKIKELTEELNLKIKSLNRKAERKSDKEEAKREKEIQTKIERFGVLLTVISLLTGISFKEKGVIEILVMIILILLVVVFSRPLINYNEFPKYLKEVVNSWKCKKNSN